MTTGAGSGKTPAQLVLAGIDRREALARAATPGPWASFFGRVRLADKRELFLTTTTGNYDDSSYLAANDPAHVLAVLAAAREELADAVAQQERHVGIGGPDSYCERCDIEWMPCPDAQQASRALARLMALYGEAQ